MSADTHISRSQILLALLLLCIAGTTALAVDRFPRPEFERDYTLPTTNTPPPRAEWLLHLDVLVLILALGAASYLAITARSRRGMLVLTIFSLLYFGFWRKGCICPVGAVQNVALALFGKTYRVPISVLAFFILPLAFTLFFGRTFCAGVCPLGAIQDLVIVRPVKVWAPLAMLLGTVPYVFLCLAILLAATGAAFPICRLDPFVGIFRFNAGFAMLAFGAAVLVLGAFVARPYCRFICPYGVLLGWLSRFSKYHASITPTDCIQCRLCEDACPFDAILKPTSASIPEPRRKGVRRLAILLALIPVLVLIGAWTAAHLNVPLSRAAIGVRIAERIEQEDSGRIQGMTLESESFRSTGKLPRELILEALLLRAGLRRNAWVLGGLLALVLSARLLMLCVHRTRTDYEIDRAACLSCARCFLSCPKERERLKEKA